MGEESERLAYLKYTRKFMRGEITKIKNKISEGLATLTGDEKVEFAERLTKLRQEIEPLNREILTLLYESKSETAVYQKEYDEASSYQSVIDLSLAKLQDQSGPTTATQNIHGSNTHGLKLPTVPLPDFSNAEGENLTTFFNNFESVVNKFNLSTYEKFLLLQEHLKNVPLILIKSLEQRSQNYESAKELLENAFADKKSQQYRCISELTGMKCSKRDNPYEYIAKMRRIMDSFQTLDITSETVMQACFWNGMNPDLQKEFIHINNTNKPSLEQIKTSMFQATERYISFSEHSFRSADNNSAF